MLRVTYQTKDPQDNRYSTGDYITKSCLLSKVNFQLKILVRLSLFWCPSETQEVQSEILKVKLGSCYHRQS